MAMAGLHDLERRHIAIGAIRALATTALVLLAYFLIPVSERPGAAIAFRLVAGLGLFTAVLSYEVRAILRSPKPILRAANALALVIPLFLVVFAWTYLTMALSAPDSFSEPLDRVTALYFTVTTFATVGFGDIHAATDTARVVVTVQMASDLIVIAVVVRLIVEAARGAFRSNAR
jgi:hypothetical protein